MFSFFLFTIFSYSISQIQFPLTSLQSSQVLHPFSSPPDTLIWHLSSEKNSSPRDINWKQHNKMQWHYSSTLISRLEEAPRWMKMAPGVDRIRDTPTPTIRSPTKTQTYTTISYVQRTHIRLMQTVNCHFSLFESLWAMLKWFFGHVLVSSTPLLLQPFLAIFLGAPRTLPNVCCRSLHLLPSAVRKVSQMTIVLGIYLWVQQSIIRKHISTTFFSFVQLCLVLSYVCELYIL